MYFHPNSGLNLDLSIGQYLAGDKGFTFDLSRRFKSGFKMGLTSQELIFQKLNTGKVLLIKDFILRCL